MLWPFYLLIAIIILNPFISMMMVNWRNWKYYHKIYKRLPFYKFEYSISNTQVYGNLGEFDEIVYFTDNNDIKLKDEVYLLNGFPHFFDLYSLFWYIKYRSYFKSYVIPYLV